MLMDSIRSLNPTAAARELLLLPHRAPQVLPTSPPVNTKQISKLRTGSMTVFLPPNLDLDISLGLPAVMLPTAQLKHHSLVEESALTVRVILQFGV